MPVPLKCTAFFQSDAGKGWSESHYRNITTPVGDLLPLLSAFQALIETLRVPLLAADCFLKAVRISYRTDTGAIASSPFKYAPVKRPANKEDGAAPTIAAMARMGTASNQQFSPIYLRGFWDAIEKDEELDFTTVKGKAWQSLLTAYVAALRSVPYGFLGQDDLLTDRGACTGYTVGGDGFITFTVDILEGPAFPPVGSPPFQIRFAGLNNGDSILNTTHMVQVVDATHVKTMVKTAALPFVSSGTFVSQETSFLAYTGLQYCILARKPMGRPTSSSPARQSARPKG